MIVYVVVRQRKKGKSDEPNSQYYAKYDDRELSDGTCLVRDQGGANADCCGDEHESERREQHRFDVRPGVDDDMFVCAQHLLRKTHAFNADTSPAIPQDCRWMTSPAP